MSQMRIFISHSSSDKIFRNALMLALTAPSALGMALLVACASQGGTQVSWQETDQPGHLAAHYAHFDGRVSRAIDVRAGQTITLTWTARAETGLVYFEVQQPDGKGIWGALVQNSQAGVVIIRACRAVTTCYLCAASRPVEALMCGGRFLSCGLPDIRIDWLRGSQSRETANRLAAGLHPSLPCVRRCVAVLPGMLAPCR